MFSSRLPDDLSPNALSTVVEEMRRRQQPFADLTASNPTDAGLEYPAEILGALANTAALRYEPHPFGMRGARAAVAADYARRGVAVDVDRIVLSASSSESYAWLFKLLCNAGDSVLVPTPSYPLFEHLTRLELVNAVPYATEYHGRWVLNAAALEQAIDESTRAVLVVSPNNPTGAWLSVDERDAVAGLCAARGLALIGDEVFCDYPLDQEQGAAASVLEQNEALTFALGGLSKSVGLPQLKMGWIAVSGPSPAIDAALRRLEIVADTYLSVGTPVQQAAARVLEAGAMVRRQIADRVLLNYGTLRVAARACPAVDVLRAEGGWSAVLRVPATRTDEEWVMALLTEARVLVHPGFYFDFAADGYLVLSLLPRPAEFEAALSRFFDAINRHS